MEGFRGGSGGASTSESGAIAQSIDEPDEMLAADAVAGQLWAYNERDIDNFLGFWSPDARIYRWPDSLVADGLGAIREVHVRRFSEPYLHAVLLSRTVLDDLVVDHERVTRTLRDRPEVVEVIAFYEVRLGLIRRAWFKQSTT